VNTTTAAFALLSLATILFGTTPQAKAHPVLTVIAIALFELCTVAVSGLGHAVLVAVQRWATWVFGALNCSSAASWWPPSPWSEVAAAHTGPGRRHDRRRRGDRRRHLDRLGQRIRRHRALPGAVGAGPARWCCPRQPAPVSRWSC